jgi:hypothetical protein
VGAKARTTDWRDFEKAVAQFIAALNPKARVTHDARMPDRDTGRPRQRDVWVEGTFAGMFPLRALVSCKHYGRPLNQLDIDHFSGELESSGANIGIIYSRRGFTSTAIAKAKTLQINCCRLYRNEPADLPETLVFASYCFVPVFWLGYSGPDPSGQTWGQLFDRRDARSRSLQDLIVEAVKRCDRGLVERVRSQRAGFRESATAGISWRDDTGEYRVTVTYQWRAYRGRVEANYLNGSYCQTSGSFTGTQAGPMIDLKGPPGAGWDPVPLDEVEDRSPVVKAFLYQGDPSGGLAALADKPIQRSTDD